MLTFIYNISLFVAVITFPVGSIVGISTALDVKELYFNLSYYTLPELTDHREFVLVKGLFTLICFLLFSFSLIIAIVSVEDRVDELGTQAALLETTEGKDV